MQAAMLQLRAAHQEGLLGDVAQLGALATKFEECVGLSPAAEEQEELTASLREAERLAGEAAEKANASQCSDALVRFCSSLAHLLPDEAAAVTKKRAGISAAALAVMSEAKNLPKPGWSEELAEKRQEVAAALTRWEQSCEGGEKTQSWMLQALRAADVEAATKTLKEWQLACTVGEMDVAQKALEEESKALKLYAGGRGDGTSWKKGIAADAPWEVASTEAQKMLFIDGQSQLTAIQKRHTSCVEALEQYTGLSKLAGVEPNRRTGKVARDLL
ncbi:MAG: hypothetical protein GY772_05225, partial [bacterium]|nr:hypothetical protein [bacterium]